MPHLKKKGRVQILAGCFYGQFATVIDNTNNDKVLIQVDGLLPDRSILNRYTIKSHYLKVIN